MAALNQGEKLLLLVRRDPRSTEEIAAGMGIDKSYLPKLYKMENLPRKSLQKAIAFFQVAENYFTEGGENEDVLAEPSSTYRTSSLAASDDLARLSEENAALREEVARLNKLLEHEKAVNANLAEAIVNMSKRS
jgi:hypothetical protein